MTLARALRCWLLAVMLPLAAPAAFAIEAPLQFRISEGRIENAFYQDGPVAAHLLLSSGDKPRALVAFPAGNSGVGLWFDDVATPVQWTLGEVKGARVVERGQAFNGIVAEASVAGPLRLRGAVLGSVRVLRDYQLGHAFPPETAAPLQLSERRASWKRARLDGAPGYALTLQVANGRFRRDGDKLLLLPDRAGEPLRIRLIALTGETPLTPFAENELLNAHASTDARSRNALRFLAYREKFLAGSWRFDTYFGRDTLMSLRLLMPALQPGAIDAGLSAVLARLSPDGEVAHEEDIGEFAVLDHRRAGEGDSAAPTYDYAMIDGNYMLAPVAQAWLLDDARGRENAARFLAADAGGMRRGDALLRNFLFVARRSAAFAADPVHSNLIALKPGHDAGQWRDSNDGLGGGRYPWDVNAVWMPAALRALGRFADSGLLNACATPAQLRQLREAAARADAWEKNASALFAVTLPHERAIAQIRGYAAKIGVDAAPALASLGAGALEFPAIALDAAGKPVPVLHSDDGFALLFGHPDAAALERSASSLLRPFPAGLLTDIGMLVANPAYANAEQQARFGNNAYHGSVVWAWQQAVWAAGLQRQLVRDDLPAPTRAHLLEAQTRLWRAIHAADAVRTSELWSWSYADGHYRIAPFGASAADADESNAAQLWSTVYLAVGQP